MTWVGVALVTVGAPPPLCGISCLMFPSRRNLRERLVCVFMPSAACALCPWLVQAAALNHIMQRLGQRLAVSAAGGTDEGQGASRSLIHALPTRFYTASGTGAGASTAASSPSGGKAAGGGSGGGRVVAAGSGGGGASASASSPTAGAGESRGGSGSGECANECLVCLGLYEEGEELRTLPCMHFFHSGECCAPVGTHRCHLTPCGLVRNPTVTPRCRGSALLCV